MTMEPLGSFGPFEIGREIDAAGGAAVYRAKKEGDPKGDYVVKVFSLERLISEQAPEAASELDPLFKDLGASFVSSVNLQKKAAESSSYFAPILAGGQDERGAWYATKFYPATIKGVLALFTALGAADIFRIVESVTKAALHLKRTCGRSHGNLKPSNIFLAQSGKRKGSVVVADPLPGGAQEAARYEKADLRAIGELIYQLAVRHKVDFDKVMLSLEPSKEWSRVFGEKTAAWLDLCGRLLEPGLSLDNISLEAIENELPALKPKPPVWRTVAPIAAGVLLVAGLAAWFAWVGHTRGTLVVTADPPGSKVIITPIVDNIRDLGNTQTNATGPDGTLKVRLKNGSYRLTANFLSPYGDTLELPPKTNIEVSVESGKPATANLNLLRGALIIESVPPGATFVINHHTYRTPFTNLYAQPGKPIEDLKLDLGADFETATIPGVVPTAGSTNVLSTTLIRRKASEVLVEFKSEPSGAEVYLDVTNEFKTDSKRSLAVGPHQVREVFRAWGLPALSVETNRNIELKLSGGANQTLPVRFPHGTIALKVQPEGTEVGVNGRSAGIITNFFLPAGTFTLDFSRPGYEPYQTNLSVSDQGIYVISRTLKALGGFLELAGYPPGAVVSTRTGELVTTNLSESPTTVPWPPGAYYLTATYGDLTPVQTNVVVTPGLTNRADFHFDYGVVIITNLLVLDSQTNATIEREDGRKVEIGQPNYQKPAASVGYRVKADWYEPFSASYAVDSKDTKLLSIKLVPVSVPMQLISDPPGATFWERVGTNLPKPLHGNETNSHRWGFPTFVARYPRLEPQYNLNGVTTNALSNKLEFHFDYRVLVLTNLPKEVTVSEGTNQVGSAADERVYERPGAHVYVLRRGSQSETRQVTLLSEKYYLSTSLTNAAPTQYTSPSTGMELVWVPGLPDTPEGGYVGKYEVTQGQYSNVIGKNPSDPVANGTNYPVNNVNVANMLDFCSLLTTRDRIADPEFFSKGLVYGLPTERQWFHLSGGSNAWNQYKNTNFSVLRDTDVSFDQATKPKEVGSASANVFGLYDVIGNVWELASTEGQKGYKIKGGSFKLSRNLPSLETWPQPDHLNTYRNVDTGFRVILVPAKPKP